MSADGSPSFAKNRFDYTAEEVQQLSDVAEVSDFSMQSGPREARAF